jgi:hypothetical protein
MHCHETSVRASAEIDAVSVDIRTLVDEFVNA